MNIAANNNELNKEAAPSIDSHNQASSDLSVENEAESKADHSDIVNTGYKANGNRIHFWLMLEKWSLKEAALAILDINPDRTQWKKNKLEFITTFKGQEYPFVDANGKVVEGYEDHLGNFIVDGEATLAEFQSKYEDLYRIFSDLDKEKASPQIWIECARAKSIDIPWLEFAIKNKLYIFDNAASTYVGGRIVEYIHVDTSHKNFPEELKYALQAWLAVSNEKTNAKPKLRIRKWLLNNTGLSEAAIERIEVTCNWEKSGGATRQG